MFINLLRLFTGDIRKDISLEPQKTVPPNIKEVVCEDPEFSILAEKFGELKAGKIIEVSLQELLTIIPRKRKRSDAYKGLVTKLKKLDVTLIINSNKTKKS